MSEKRPTHEQVERARAWQLPDTFYLYEDAPPCPGCPGCDPDDLLENAEKSTSFPRFFGFGLPQSSEGSAEGGMAGPEEGGKSPLYELLFGSSKLGQVIPSAASSSQGPKTSAIAPDKAGLFVFACICICWDGQINVVLSGNL